jgi:hypothetical protein
MCDFSSSRGRIERPADRAWVRQHPRINAIQAHTIRTSAMRCRRESLLLICRKEFLRAGSPKLHEKS